MAPVEYDAIVVGARIAGSATALHLARHGYTVLLLDRDRFPSPTLSTHLFFTDTLGAFRELGVLERVLAVDAPRLRWLRFPYVAAPFPEHDGLDFALCIRREVLDTILLEQAAAQPGITVQAGTQVTGLIWDDDRVVGVRYRARRGRTEGEVRARIVIGADGRGSFVARAAGAVEYDAVPPLFAWYYAYMIDVPLDDPPSAAAFRGPFPEVGAEYSAAFIFPADGGLTLVGFGVEHAAFGRFRRNVRQSFFAGLRSLPAVWERVGQARLVSRVLGTGHLPNFFRAAWGPGWALVGDAGCHKDPHTVQGMGDAVRSARLLATALDRWWRGQASEEESLSWYQHERDADLRPMYDFTTFRLQAQVGDEIWERFNQLTWEDEGLACRRVAAMTHAVHPADVYTPEAVLRAVHAHSAA
ncbi:NAD(P)/FAD-dependent oxidoreductase [Thermomicrobiaceae bacterium CFH 74404]|uniref:NAD(P)/FAD-dependent oxidoreductase n=1 Tax=Thermalbibacter longus TaxID=2951981 RepID=A0AA41WCV7_9BACT|nr:NAD(P)/FAD-dependent oxidoreductase [Thermalbibacter longus]MCM8747718.1 NAD(P)/FAD-dependent oxidoreductase [Thermalbibacter longus]